MKIKRSGSPKRAVLLPVVLVCSALVAACSSGVTSTGSSDTVEPSLAPGATGSTQMSTTSGSVDRVAGSYESAVTDKVVANDAFDPLTQEITARFTSAGLPGSSLLVIQNGVLVEQEAMGSYDLNTVVPIASASKWLSGVTIMSLVDDGLIDLDEPIRTYLPDTKGPSGAITTRQLMSFTSGLEYDEKIPCYEDLSKTLSQCNAEILALPLLGAPGTGFRYTGTHLHVAAGVAEAVTGKKWEELFQERVAKPLHMDSTTFVAGLHAVAAAPDGHPAPAGSARSTLGDYGRFLEMLAHDGVAPDGTTILSQESIAEMGTDQITDAEYLSAAGNREASRTPYGLAHWVDVTNSDGRALVESSPGKFGFRPWIDHVNNIVGVHLIVDKNTSVRTSGNWVPAATAKALGGTVPDGTRR